MTQNKPKWKIKVTEKRPKKSSQARTESSPEALKLGKQSQNKKKHTQSDQN